MAFGKRLRTRLSPVIAAGCAFLLWGAASLAMPIRPDLKKIVAEPQQSPVEFPLARAGWNGPESAHAPAALNATFEQFGPTAAARQVRDSLRTAFIPDYRALAAIALVILLLRRMRRARRKAIPNDPEHRGDAGLPQPHAKTASAADSDVRRAA